MSVTQRGSAPEFWLQWIGVHGWRQGDSGGLSWGHGNGQERRRQVLELSISEMKRLAGNQGNSQPPHLGDWSSLRWDQGCWGSFGEDGELSVASA